MNRRHSGMSMSGMDMAMSSDPIFRTYDSLLARCYWYIIASLLSIILLLRAFEHWSLSSLLRLSLTHSISHPTRPQNPITQTYATLTAILRELSYPQLHFNGRFAWLTPPNSGRVILLLGYWSIITFFLTYKSIINDVSFYERIGYRGAWISVTQVPLIYLLSSKSSLSLLTLLSGLSHERLNWLHRWVSRTLLVTVTVHGGHFMAMWVRGGILELELWMMPMVGYGIGAWGVLVWTFFSSLNPVRGVAYEVFVVQHIAAAGVFLWLVYVHVPGYAVYNVWFAVGAVAFDFVFRGLQFLYRNVVLGLVGKNLSARRSGFEAELKRYGENITIIMVKDVPISWKPGQYLYLWIPRLGLLETHPFTIASPYIAPPTRQHPSDIQFAVRTQSGFSKRIRDYARQEHRLSSSSSSTLRAFIAGPYGTPPNWKGYETLILISASTGSSFTLPILENVLYSTETNCVRRIYFLFVVRSRSEAEFYIERLHAASSRAVVVGIELEVRVAVTGRGSSGEEVGGEEVEGGQDGAGEERETSGMVQNEMETITPPLEKAQNTSYTLMKSTSHSPSSSTSSNQRCASASNQLGSGYIVLETADIEHTNSHSDILYTEGRPSIEEFVLGPVEVTGGETMVAVCGGKSLVAGVRNCVARLSNERAVHKGTGAQGIYLHVEEYSF